ncbi:MAG: hypothetical protein ACQPRJ_02285 [Solitalea-like symbiont of Acarus siro]
MSDGKKTTIDLEDLYTKKTSLPLRRTFLIDDILYNKLKFLLSQIPFRAGQNISLSYFCINIINDFLEKHRGEIEQYIKDNQKKGPSMF